MIHDITYYKKIQKMCIRDSYNPLLEPKDFPRQIIYGSSASDTDSAFYKKLKEYTRQMIMGNSLYFVCDFDIDAVMAATVNGVALPEPLISQSKVDQANLLTPDKAQREQMCIRDRHRANRLICKCHLV